MSRIAVFGAGSWGTAFSLVLADAGHVLADRAAPGQLLVSPAVRDLVADTGLSFVPAGEGAYRAAVPTPTIGRTS